MADANLQPTLPLRLPVSLRARATELAAEQGVSLNFFIMTALAEWIARAEQKRLDMAALAATAAADEVPAEAATPANSEESDP